WWVHSKSSYAPERWRAARKRKPRDRIVSHRRMPSSGRRIAPPAPVVVDRTPPPTRGWLSNQLHALYSWLVLLAFYLAPCLLWPQRSGLPSRDLGAARSRGCSAAWVGFLPCRSALAAGPARSPELCGRFLPS